MKAEWTNKDVLTQSETIGQSKSILVIDTPKNCAECKLIHLQGIGEAICDAVDWEERPSWCPLKPMPKKKPFATRGRQSGFSMVDVIKNTERMGWNECLDAIMGETE